MADIAWLKLADEALSQWDLDAVDVREVSRSENVVFRVRTEDGGVFVLRIHRPGYHTYDELVSEQTWTASLSSAGIDVPVPVPTREGLHYGSIGVEGEQRIVGMLEWVEGETMRSLIAASTDSQAIEARFEQLGEILALMHNQAAEWQPPAEFTRHAVDADGLMGEQPFWGPFWKSAALSAAEQIQLGALRSRIFSLLRKLPTCHQTYSMIHADLHPGNVVVNGSRLHVIDFDDAGFGWHVYDLAVALKDYEEHSEIASFQRALVSGYRRLRPVSNELLDLIPLFLLIRALATIGWIAARPELAHDEFTPILLSHIDARAEEVLARYE